MSFNLHPVEKPKEEKIKVIPKPKELETKLIVTDSTPPPAPVSLDEILAYKEMYKSLTQRLDTLEKQVGSKDMAKTAWLNMRKSIKRLADTGHPDRVGMVSILDQYFNIVGD